MRIIGRTALAASAVLAVGVLAACSDSPTASKPQTALVPKVGFALSAGDLTDNTPVAQYLKICKVGDVGGTFDITSTAAQAPGPAGNTTGGSGNPTVTTPLNVAVNTCRVAAVDAGNATQEMGDFFHVAEADQANVTETLDSCVLNGDNGGPPVAITCNDNFFINTVHGVVLTFSNVTVPQPPANVCDFSTFGGFVLLPNNISYGGNAGRVDGGFAYGDLNFVNHTNGDHIHVWNVTDYGHPDTGPLSQFDDSRLAFGLGSVNGGPVNVPVEWRFLDAGEPAKKLGDMVYLKVGDTVLIPEQNVNGGNIQLHPKCKKAPKAEKH